MFHVVSCVDYLYVSCSGPITSVGDETELICQLLFTCKNVVSVGGSFIFLWMLEMGCVILLWQSLSLPFKYFGSIFIFNIGVPPSTFVNVTFLLTFLLEEQSLHD